MKSEKILEIVDPTDYPQWDDLILNSAQYSVFHSSAWCKVLHDSYNYKPFYFVARKDDRFETVIPFMEISSPITGKRGVSLPFTDYGPIIISENSNTNRYFNFIYELGEQHGWKYLEFRDNKIIPENSPVQVEFYQHVLDLSDDGTEVFNKFRDSTKRNIKKAKKRGIATRISRSKDGMENFCRLNTSTRKKHGLPPQPDIFFSKMFEHVISKDLGFVVEALFEDKTIAVALYLTYGGRVVYKYGASDSRFLNLRANNLVMWHAIEWACSEGFKTFDFGRTEIYNKGLIQFKNGWGCKPSLINYYKYLLATKTFVTGNGKESHFYEKVFRVTPEPVLKVFGNIIYKHMG
jgi:hypothetical protein